MKKRVGNYEDLNSRKTSLVREWKRELWQNLFIATAENRYWGSEQNRLQEIPWFETSASKINMIIMCRIVYFNKNAIVIIHLLGAIVSETPLGI